MTIETIHKKKEISTLIIIKKKMHIIIIIKCICIQIKKKNTFQPKKMKQIIMQKTQKKLTKNESKETLKKCQKIKVKPIHTVIIIIKTMKLDIELYENLIASNSKSKIKKYIKLT